MLIILIRKYINLLKIKKGRIKPNMEEDAIETMDNL